MSEKFNLTAVLSKLHINKPRRKEMGTMTPECKGMNCHCTNGRDHSLECEAEHAASIAGGSFVKHGDTAVVSQQENKNAFVPHFTGGVMCRLCGQCPGYHGPHGECLEEDQLRDAAKINVAKPAEPTPVSAPSPSLLEELVSAMEAILKHDGGVGSSCYDARELGLARAEGWAALAKAREEMGRG